MSDVHTLSRVDLSLTGLDLEFDFENEEESSVAIPSVPIQFNLHSWYYNDFFLLRTLIAINGTPAEIKIDPSGTSFIQHSESSLDYPLSNLVPGVATTLNEKYGVYHVDTFYHEDAALFSVVFPSQSGQRKFLEHKDRLQSDLVELLSAQFRTGSQACQQTPTHSRYESQLQVSIDAELFLASPTISIEQGEQSPRVCKVTLATFEHFIEKWQQSKQFDFVSSMFSDDTLSQPQLEEAKLKVLQRELKGVINWFQLGLELDMPADELLVIREDIRGVEQCLLEVLIKWRDREKPTWTKVVRALVKIGRHVLAENIAKKYGIKLPTIPEETSDKIVDIEQKLSGKHRALDTAVQSRDNLIENIGTDLSAELIELQGQNSSLADEIEYLRLKLQHKSKESEYLEESQKKMKSSWKETVERMKKDSIEQIKQLQQQLAMKSNQLTQIQEQLEQKEIELEEKIAEVEEKSALVMQLKEEVEKLKQSFREQQQEMNLTQIELTAYSMACERHLEEIKLQIGEKKHEAEVKKKEIETHTQNVATRNEKINQLSAIIKENESRMDELQEEAVLSENEQRLLKLSLCVKVVHLKEQLKNAEHAKWLSQLELKRAQEDLRKYNATIPDITKCTVSLPQEKLEKHTLSHLRVCLFNEDGDPCIGSHHIDTKLTLLGSGDSIVAGTFSKPVKDNSGEYVVSFTPTRAGDCEIQVAVNGTPVPSGPLSVMVYDNSEAGNCCATGHGLGVAVAEKEMDSGSQVVLLDNDSDICRMKDDVEPQGKHNPFTIAATSPPHILIRPVRVIGNLKGPCFVTTNSHNQIIVAQNSFHCVSVVSPEGKKIYSFGSYGTNDGQFKIPTGVAVDHVGNIYVVDYSNHRIQKFTPDGNYIQDSGQLDFNFPMGVSFNPNNRKVYVCDQNNHRIQVLNTDLSYYSTIGRKGTGDGEFKYAMDIAFNSKGNIYVTDYDNHRVQIFNPDGTFLSTLSNKQQEEMLEYPFGIAVDSSDTVYVSEQDRGCISVFSAEGNYLTTFGGVEGKAERRFNWPSGLHIDKNGALLVCDTDKD